MRVQYHFHIVFLLKMRKGVKTERKMANICVKHVKALQQEYKHNLEPVGRLLSSFFSIPQSVQYLFVYICACILALLFHILTTTTSFYGFEFLTMRSLHWHCAGTIIIIYSILAPQNAYKTLGIYIMFIPHLLCNIVGIARWK